MILYEKALEMCTYENFASWSWTLFPVPSYMLLILGEHFYDGYSMKHLCKTFWHTPSSFLIPSPPPLPVHRANFGSERQKENLKALLLKMTKKTDPQYLAFQSWRHYERIPTQSKTVLNFSTNSTNILLPMMKLWCHYSPPFRWI